MAKVNNRNCCVFNCSSKGGKENGLSFHSFPKPKENMVSVVTKFGTTECIDRRTAWVKATRVNKKITPFMKVCCRHFKASDYFPDVLYVQPKRKVLLKTAVPSLNLPSASYTRVVKERPYPRPYIQRKDEAEVAEVLVSLQDCAKDENPIILSEDVENMHVEEKRATRDIGIQVNLLKEEASNEVFVSLVNTDKKLNTMTGLNRQTLLDNVVSYVAAIAPTKKCGKFSIKERVLLTLIKLKCNMLFVVLAVLFNTSPATCKRVFQETISLITTVMTSVIYFPTQEEIFQNLPLVFKGFEDVRVVLDCTEMAISVRKCLCCRLKTYSHYKGTSTVKFMTGVTPAGLISFISQAYGGRASDKVIFEQSGLVDLLEPTVDAVMVDKGFLIQQTAKQHFIKVYQPPFLRKKSQFNQEEANTTRKIAAARVHIERVNQRIKQFAILQHRLHYNMLPYVDQIFITICGIVNLSPPILNNDKFIQ